MDDMLIATDTMEEHQEQILHVLKKLKANDLYLKGEKCVFHAQKLEFLRMIIEPGKISMDPIKVKGMLD